MASRSAHKDIDGLTKPPLACCVWAIFRFEAIGFLHTARNVKDASFEVILQLQQYCRQSEKLVGQPSLSFGSLQ